MSSHTETPPPSELPQICVVIGISSNIIKHIDPISHDVWEMTDGETSSVGVDGVSVVDTSVRKSESIYKKFEINNEKKCYSTSESVNIIRRLFKKVHFGIGTKHIYSRGGFMKEHHDKKFPPHRLDNGDELPHIMTMIVTKSLDDFRICGKSLDTVHIRESSYGAMHYVILFTLNCPHEVLPVTSTRHSFVFPVYGIYNGVRMSRVNNPLKSVYSDFLERIDDVINDSPDCRGLSALYGASKGISENIRILTAAICKIRDVYIRDDDGYNGDDYDDDNCVRNDNDDETVMRLLIILRKMIVELEEDVTSEYKEFLNTETAPIPDDIIVPSCPFVIVLNGRYLPDSSIADLVPFDKRLYEFFSRSYATDFAPVTRTNMEELKTYYYIDSNFKLCNGSDYASKRLKKLSVDDVYVEYDDEGGYDPHYSRVRAVLVVNYKL